MRASLDLARLAIRLLRVGTYSALLKIIMSSCTITPIVTEGKELGDADKFLRAYILGEGWKDRNKDAKDNYEEYIAKGHGRGMDDVVDKED